MADPVTVPAADDSGTWAPSGWEPADVWLDDSPFGSVLGDPLMGSPLFDVSVLDASPTASDEAEDQSVTYGITPGGPVPDAGSRPGAPHGAADQTAAMRAQVEAQLRALREETARRQRAAGQAPPPGRIPSRAAAAQAGRQQRMSAPQMPYANQAGYGQVPPPPGAYGQPPRGAYGVGPAPAPPAYGSPGPGVTPIHPGPYGRRPAPARPQSASSTGSSAWAVLGIIAVFLFMGLAQCSG